MGSMKALSGVMAGMEGSDQDGAGGDTGLPPLASALVGVSAAGLQVLAVGQLELHRLCVCAMHVCVRACVCAQCVCVCVCVYVQCMCMCVCVCACEKNHVEVTNFARKCPK